MHKRTLGGGLDPGGDQRGLGGLLGVVQLSLGKEVAVDLGSRCVEASHHVHSLLGLESKC